MHMLTPVNKNALHRLAVGQITLMAQCQIVIHPLSRRMKPVLHTRRWEKKYRLQLANVQDSFPVAV
jgi:hypothetical protein